MDYMPERRQEGARVLHQHDVPPADAMANVDVEELLAKLAERTAELAEARLRRKHAEATLKTKTRELEAERKAHKETRWGLEADCRELEKERREAGGECRELKAKVAEQRDARAAAEAELKRAEERSVALQRQLQVVWAQLQQQKPAGPQPWWRKLGS
jgi:chromosome segregation ATPase